MSAASSAGFPGVFDSQRPPPAYPGAPRITPEGTVVTAPGGIERWGMEEQMIRPPHPAGQPVQPGTCFSSCHAVISSWQ